MSRYRPCRPVLQVRPNLLATQLFSLSADFAKGLPLHSPDGSIEHMIELQPATGDDPLADIADLLVPPYSHDSGYPQVTFDPQDPDDAEELARDLSAAGPLSDDLLQFLGWDEPPDHFSVEDVEPPIGDLDDETLLADVQATHRATAATQARLALLITELTHRRAEHAVTELTGRHARGLEALSIGARAVTEEVALELCLGKSAAAHVTDTALGLCTQTPDTLDALMRGDIDLDRARTILQMTQSLIMAQTDTNADLPPAEQTDPDRLGHDFEAELLKKAPRQTQAQLRRTGEKAQIKANPRA